MGLSCWNQCICTELGHCIHVISGEIASNWIPVVSCLYHVVRRVCGYKIHLLRNGVSMPKLVLFQKGMEVDVVHDMKLHTFQKKECNLNVFLWAQRSCNCQQALFSQLCVHILALQQCRKPTWLTLCKLLAISAFIYCMKYMQLLPRSSDLKIWPRPFGLQDRSTAEQIDNWRITLPQSFKKPTFLMEMDRQWTWRCWALSFQHWCAKL